MSYVIKHPRLGYYSRSTRSNACTGAAFWEAFSYTSKDGKDCFDGGFPLNWNGKIPENAIRFATRDEALDYPTWKGRARDLDGFLKVVKTRLVKKPESEIPVP